MYHLYRFLAEGVASADYKFKDFETREISLASRHDGIFELVVKVPNMSNNPNPNPYKEVKFISDDKFLPLNSVLELDLQTMLCEFLKKNPKPTMQQFQALNKKVEQVEPLMNMLSEFLKENSTPTLGELRELNKKLVTVQIKAEKTDYAPEK